MIPAGKRRETQKAETRELILDSARSLFETEGYAKTTMRAVAIQAQIGLGTIYKHFTNKAELLAAAMLGDLTRLDDTAFHTIPSDQGIKAQYLHVARQFFTYYTTRPALARAYLANLFSMDAQGFDEITAFDERYAVKVTELVRQAQRRGEIGSDRDCDFIAMSFMADYFFVLMTFLVRYNETDLEKMLDVLGRMLDETIH